MRLLTRWPYDRPGTESSNEAKGWLYPTFAVTKVIDNNGKIMEYDLFEMDFYIILCIWYWFVFMCFCFSNGYLEGLRTYWRGNHTKTPTSDAGVHAAQAITGMPKKKTTWTRGVMVADRPASKTMVWWCLMVKLWLKHETDPTLSSEYASLRWR